MLLIDAYNVLHTTGVLPPEIAGPDLGQLAGLIRTSRYGSREFRLVCDGLINRRAQTHRGLDLDSAVMEAGPGQQADDLLEWLVRTDTARARLTIVSSDRRLRKFASAQGCGSLTSQLFLEHLAEDHDLSRRAGRRVKPLPGLPPLPLDLETTAHWMAEFGLGQPQRTAPKPRPIEMPKVKDKSSQPKAELKTAETPSLAPKPQAPRPTEADPLLKEALDYWAGRLSLDDLDMHRWLPPDSSKDPPSRR
jgi:YacP-like NYN domain